MKRMLLISLVVLVAVLAHAENYGIQHTPWVAGERPRRALSHVGQKSKNETQLTDMVRNSPEWEKYKILKGIGYVTLGVGVPTTLVGLFTRATLFNELGKRNAGNAIIIAGGGLTIIGIPLILIADNYKSKALHNIDLTSECMYIYDNSAPSLSLNLTF